MAFDFIEGFDYYPDNISAGGVGLQATWIYSNNGNGGADGTALIEGRYLPGKAMEVGGQVGAYSARWTRVVPSATRKVIGFAFRPGSMGDWSAGLGAKFLMLTDQLDRELLVLSLNNVGELRLKTNGINMVPSKRRLLDNTWHYIEFEYTLDDGVNGKLRLVIDGEEQYVWAGDSRQYDDSTISRIVAYAASREGGQFWAWDDLYCITNGLTVLGECRIQLLEAVANAGVQFTPSKGTNYSNINEQSVDGDTSYNFANTPGFTDYFDFSDITVTPDKIHAVGLVLAARKIDSGTRTIRTKLKSDVGSFSGVPYNLVVQYSWVRDIVEKDPNGNLPWIRSGVNAMTVGYELVL